MASSSIACPFGTFSGSVTFGIVVYCTRVLKSWLLQMALSTSEVQDARFAGTPWLLFATSSACCLRNCTGIDWPEV